MAHIKPAPDQLDDWRVFAKRIYKEWDADPGYYALRMTPGVHHDQRLRMAVAWCAYYNLGIAADASTRQGAAFWNYLEEIYPTAKRATERRHFRGQAGLEALKQWRTSWPKPEALAEHMAGQTYFEIRKKGQMVRQYGDYFFWKWCDLNEVLGMNSPDMTGSEKYSPKLPQQGAKLIYEMDQDNMVDWPKSAPFDPSENSELVAATYAEIVRFGQRNKIPPRTTDSRRFDIQEAETVACVYKQMANGSYTYGTRTAKAVKRLEAANSNTAKKMAATLLELSPYTKIELFAALDSLTK